MVSVPGFSHTYDVFFVDLRWSCESAIVSHILDCLGRDLWDGDRGSWIVDRGSMLRTGFGCCGRAVLGLSRLRWFY
jgi:hypothetical protein